ncbi:hypothetical protein BaRGS_00008641 [Batillaria attramentaria]|uniref:Secreted protein n=1 Tax=Batillaria attramentaria TaxID=370345 RepID=A0ABD0LM63_9CAEN
MEGWRRGRGCWMVLSLNSLATRPVGDTRSAGGGVEGWGGRDHSTGPPVERKAFCVDASRGGLAISDAVITSFQFLFYLSPPSFVGRPFLNTLSLLHQQHPHLASLSVFCVTVHCFDSI